eukprot:m.60118 g.60118  ORF g.60118 m.60118 type:complete len:103 (-) comp22803_c0_seq1:60-368(-)
MRIYTSCGASSPLTSLLSALDLRFRSFRRSSFGSAAPSSAIFFATTMFNDAKLVPLFFFVVVCYQRKSRSSYTQHGLILPQDKRLQTQYLAKIQSNERKKKI